MSALRRISRRGRVCILSVIAAAGCSDPAAPPIPASIAPAGSVPATAAAGTTLTPAFMVLDARGRPVRGATVAFQPGQGGTVENATAQTDANGRVSPGLWTLGPQAGPQTLRVTAGAVSFTLTVQAEAGAPASMAPLGSNPATGVTGEPVVPPPGVIVRDAHGNPVPGALVSFTPAANSGVVEGAVRSTDAAGIARPGSWTLGEQPGTQALGAATSGLVTTLTVQALADTPPASVEPLAANPDTAEASQPVVPVPGVIVRDQHGDPVAGAEVVFTAGVNSGSVTGPIQTTDENGIARPESWTLGPAGGEQLLLAEVSSLVATISIVALGQPFHVFAGNNTTCPLGTDSCAFTVSVTTRTGEPVPNATVVWTASNGATLTTLSNSFGRATAPNLIQDGALGTRTQTARLESTGDEITFTYELVLPGQYNIDVRFIGNATASQQAVFNAARDRWEEVITGDLPQVSLRVDAGDCTVDHPKIDEVVDDLVIFIQVDSIDGVGRTLGSAGPCYIRNSSRLPVMGIMRLDQADVQNLESNGTLFDVVLHEMGHVLGIGTLWTEPQLDLLIGAGGSDPFFTGAYAVPEFVLLGGTLINGVPVENTGGPGTADGHWRDRTFANELMTGFINNAGNPLSSLTIASLLDLGYEVNFGAADEYVVPGGTAGYRMAMQQGGFHLSEALLPRPRVLPRAAER